MESGRIFQETFFHRSNITNVLAFVRNSIKEKYCVDLGQRCDKYCHEMCRYAFFANSSRFSLVDLRDVKKAVLKMNIITISLIVNAIEQTNKEQLEKALRQAKTPRPTEEASSPPPPPQTPFGWVSRKTPRYKSIPIEMTVATNECAGEAMRLDDLITYETARRQQKQKTQTPVRRDPEPAVNEQTIVESSVQTTALPKFFLPDAQRAAVGVGVDERQRSVDPDSTMVELKSGGPTSISAEGWDAVELISVEVEYQCCSGQNKDRRFYFCENDSEMLMFEIPIDTSSVHEIIDLIREKMNAMGSETYDVSLGCDGLVTVEQVSGGANARFSIMFEQTPKTCHESVGFSKKNYENMKVYKGSQKVTDSLSLNVKVNDNPPVEIQLTRSQSKCKVRLNRTIEVADADVIGADVKFADEGATVTEYTLTFKVVERRAGVCQRRSLKL